MSPEDVNPEDNMIMIMLSPLHEQFGLFHFILENTSTPNRYRLKLFPRFVSVYIPILPSHRIVTLTSYNDRFPLPE